MAALCTYRLLPYVASPLWWSSPSSPHCQCPSWRSHRPPTLRPLCSAGPPALLGVLAAAHGLGLGLGLLLAAVEHVVQVRRRGVQRVSSAVAVAGR